MVARQRQASVWERNKDEVQLGTRNKEQRTLSMRKVPLSPTKTLTARREGTGLWVVFRIPVRSRVNILTGQETSLSQHCICVAEQVFIYYADFHDQLLIGRRYMSDNEYKRKFIHACQITLLTVRLYIKAILARQIQIINNVLSRSILFDRYPARHVMTCTEVVAKHSDVSDLYPHRDDNQEKRDSDFRMEQDVRKQSVWNALYPIMAAISVWQVEWTSVLFERQRVGTRLWPFRVNTFFIVNVEWSKLSH